MKPHDAFQSLEAMEPRLCLSGAVQTPSTFFPIGVFSQPTGSFNTWKSRGVNTLVKYESQGGTVSIDTWSNAANKAGMYQIREPRRQPNKDASETKLLAWLQPDEPEVNGISSSTLSRNYSSWKRADPNKPIMTNFSGGSLLTGTTSAATYQNSYLPYTDWVGNDFYPVTGWDRSDWIDYSQNPPDGHKTEGMAVSQFAQISNHKPQWAFIETSDQNLSWTPADTPGVTADQFRGELWDSIIHGARGVVYFPQSFNPFQYDATPSSVVTEMTAQDARIQGTVASVLNSVTDPTDASLQLTFTNGDHPNYLEGTMRPKGPNGDRYFFVLNMSSAALTGQRVDLPNLAASSTLSVVGEADPVTGQTPRTVAAQSDSLGSYVTDDFAPFELHIYEAAAAAATPASAAAVPSATSSSSGTLSWGPTISVTTAPATWTISGNDLSGWLSGIPANASTGSLHDLLR